MNKRNALLLNILFIFTISSCTEQATPPQESTNKSYSKSKSSSKSKKVHLLQEEKIDDNISKSPVNELQLNEKKSLDTAFIPKTDLIKNRYLEYSINLTYETIKLKDSRKKLLLILEKYGFLTSAHSNISNKNSYMSIDFKIQSTKIYNALIEFDALGILKSEKITVNDLTESMMKSQRKIHRENLRLIRKNKATQFNSYKKRNWMQIENSLERSENNIDTSKNKKWKIEDRVKWAKIHIYLRSPKAPDSIEVPNYLDALTGMINLVLNIFYYILYLMPVFVFIGIFLIFRKKIFSFRIKNK